MNHFLSHSPKTSQQRVLVILTSFGLVLRCDSSTVVTGIGSPKKMEKPYYACNKEAIHRTGRPLMPQMSYAGWWLRTRLDPNHPVWIQHRFLPNSGAVATCFTSLCLQGRHLTLLLELFWCCNKWVNVKKHLEQCQAHSDTKYRNWELLEK